MMSGTLVTIQPDGTETKERFAKKPTLDDLQKAVGGLIERVRVRYEGRVRDAFVNEEGLYKDGRFNAKATGMLAAPYNFAGAGLVGPMTVFVPDPKPKKTTPRALCPWCFTRLPLRPDGTLPFHGDLGARCCGSEKKPDPNRCTS